MPYLDDWSIVTNPFQAPEIRSSKLKGIVAGHNKFADGQRVITSAIIGCYEDFILTASGNSYQLGNVSKEYEEIYPDAKKRLFNSWRKRIND